MPSLPNPRHERFCQALAQGKTADAAYVEAGYVAHRGNASTLRSKPSIKERVAEILDKRGAIDTESVASAISALALTKAWVLEQLMGNVLKGTGRHPMKDKDGNDVYRCDLAAANRALELLGKEQGMFIDRKEVGDPGEFEALSDEELQRELIREAQQILGPLPEPNGSKH